MTIAQFEDQLSSELNSFKGSKKLLEAIRYSLLSPGKRVRPQMVFASARAVSLSASQAAAVAVSIEMIHCFTLIHDDLPCMDNDDLRRGLPTNHKKFGEATALLAGDALIPMALEVFSKVFMTVKPENFHAALAYFCKMMGPEGVMGGQAEEAELLAHPSFEKLIEVFEKKTGALFSASLTLPALLNGSNVNIINAFQKMGTEYGVIFQIADDLEDAHQKNALSILNYMDFEKALKTAQNRLAEIKKSLDEMGQTLDVTQLMALHHIFEKKLQLCQK